MSFREKTAWVTMFAILFVSLLYWFHMPNPFQPSTAPRVLHAMGASIAAYVVIEAIAWLVLRRRDPHDARLPRDERERLIDLKAVGVAYLVFVAGAIGGIFVTLHLVGAGPVAVAMVVFTAFVVSQIARHAARIVYYRRDA